MSQVRVFFGSLQPFNITLGQTKEASGFVKWSNGTKIGVLLLEMCISQM